MPAGLDLDCNESNINWSIPENVVLTLFSLLYGNVSFQIRNFPAELQLAKVTSVFTKRIPFQKNNHTLSVLSHVSKMF